MSGPLPVRIVESATRAILEAAEWWSANRPRLPMHSPRSSIARFNSLLHSQRSARRLETLPLRVFVAFTLPASITISTTGSSQNLQQSRFLHSGIRSAVPRPNYPSSGALLHSRPFAACVSADKERPRPGFAGGEHCPKLHSSNAKNGTSCAAKRPRRRKVSHGRLSAPFVSSDR